MSTEARLGHPGRISKFAAVGISGIGVNTFFLWFFTEIVGIHYMISSPMAVELAVIWNFMLNNYWTFADSADTAPFSARMLRFHLTSAGGFVVSYSLLVGLTELAGLYYLLSNLVGIFAAFIWNYVVNARWTWGRSRP